MAILILGKPKKKRSQDNFNGKIAIFKSGWYYMGVDGCVTTPIKGLYTPS